MVLIKKLEVDHYARAQGNLLRKCRPNKYTIMEIICGCNTTGIIPTREYPVSSAIFIRVTIYFKVCFPIVTLYPNPFYFLHLAAAGAGGTARNHEQGKENEMKQVR